MKNLYLSLDVELKIIDEETEVKEVYKAFSKNLEFSKPNEAFSLRNILKTYILDH